MRFVAKWLKIIAWIELVGGVIFSLVIGGSAMTVGSSFGGGGGGLAGFAVILAFLIVTAIIFMTTYASAEGILVFLAIEKNTRKDE